MSTKETGTFEWNEHWTDSVRLNQKFLANLRKEAPDVVSNKAAYQVYMKYHRRLRPPYAPNESEDGIYQMNVRNQLAKMAWIGILEKVGPGRYIWSDDDDSKYFGDPEYPEAIPQ